MLPAELAQRIDWKTLELQTGTFVDPSLAASQSDLLFRAKIDDRDVFVYVLFEHQSSPDALMPLRLLRYVVRILEAHIRKSADPLPLPSVIPVVLHHSESGWTAPTELAPLFVEALIAVPELARWTPQFQFVLDDISRLSDEALHARALGAFPSLVLWALRDARTPARLLATMGLWAEAFAAVAGAPSGKDALVALFRYISLVSELPATTLHDTVQRVAPEAEEAVMTLAEQLIQQGRTEGRSEGRAEGRAEGRTEGRRGQLRRLLRAKFGGVPTAYEGKLDAASEDQLDAWAERLLVADCVESVFSDDH